MTADDRCATLAARQHGCVTRAQVLRCGLSPDSIARRCRSRRWIRLLPEVYSVHGAPRTPEQRHVAAALWAGDGAALSHGSAAWLWGFPDATPGIPEISYPGNKRTRAGVLVHRVDLDARDITQLDDLPVTTPARTLVDMAWHLGARRFDTAFHYCLHRRLATLDGVASVARRRACRPGAGVVRAALADYSGGPPAASALEARAARLLARSSLPRPRQQYEVVVEGRVRYLDFAWPEHRVALEVDGYRWHSSRGAWESDRARARELRRAGWTVVTATFGDITKAPDPLIAELAALVAQ